MFSLYPPTWMISYPFFISFVKKYFQWLLKRLSLMAVFCVWYVVATTTSVFPSIINNFKRLSVRLTAIKHHKSWIVDTTCLTKCFINSWKSSVFTHPFSEHCCIVPGGTRFIRDGFLFSGRTKCPVASEWH